MTKEELARHGIKIICKGRSWKVEYGLVLHARGHTSGYDARKRAKQAALESACALFVKLRIKGEFDKRWPWTFGNISRQQAKVWSADLFKSLQGKSFMSKFLNAVPGAVIELPKGVKPEDLP